MRLAILPLVAAALAAVVSLAAFEAGAQTTQPPTPQANPQVIEPQVARRDLKLPKFPSNDIEIGLFGGTYATQNFGSAAVGGVRLGYHITEDFFVSAAYAQTKVSDEAFRQILPGGVFVNRKETLTYYNFSVGYNLISGEAFFGRNTAKPLQGYLIAGVGSTEFAGQKKQTVNFGFGLRLYLSDRFALQADVRDHMFPLDLLGRRDNTQNIEIGVGITAYF
jgi:outer membrane beta-barrel protein